MGIVQRPQLPIKAELQIILPIRRVIVKIEQPRTGQCHCSLLQYAQITT
jgi:hypothetical protein